MARVRCIMMQKDESFLLEPWLLYNGYLFGFENLTVYDNGSILPEVVATLARFAAAGVTVVSNHGQPADWVIKGDHFTSAIQAWDRNGDYDFAIPLDCDEFIALFTPTGVTCRRSDIHAYLDSLIGTEGVFAIDTTNFNVPGRAGWFWPGQGSKRFFAANTIGTLDHGYHIATSRKSAAVVATQLTHLHFHNKPYATLIEHSRRKLMHYVDVDDQAAVAAFKGPNCHLVHSFLQTEQEYMAQMDVRLTFSFTGLATLMAALGHRSPMLTLDSSGTQIAPRQDIAVRQPAVGHQPGRITVFDAQAYQTAHVDVAAAGVYPLRHYLYVGFYEGRATSDVRDVPMQQPLPWSGPPSA